MSREKLTLSAERKKQIEDEEKAKFAAKRESFEEIEYRNKVKANLESGGFAGFLKKQVKDAVGL